MFPIKSNITKTGNLNFPHILTTIPERMAPSRAQFNRLVIRKNIYGTHNINTGMLKFSKSNT